ncbi:uncharacterized protein LOC106159526 [Lingula anatina]|uniref:Uncharacterized protein LOC106159526 n=1 Tax=Lingula anatina TaxID=7574 RepID=A0A1S3HZ31_LINAN|nr:uncharacterized protein LOC106159526 [Lingula anatina]|eukprot:XP_013391280.1 uncharacterized protein LOC106159526 [Lingula anatina]
MKGILVFSELNDILFVNTDHDFKLHLRRKALEAQLIQAEDFQKDELDSNVIVQLFSPLVNSQRFMIETVQNPYTSIECENGFLFVFKQFQDQLHIAINGDGSEAEDFLHRKLLVFQRLLSFLFGPAIERLRPDLTAARKATWSRVSHLVDTWCTLVESDQAFLVEAFERLNVNQAVNGMCISILESCLEKLRSGEDRNAIHALLLVNTKLLALFSSRNAWELQSSDMLLLTLLVQSQFRLTPEDASAEFTDTVTHNTVKETKTPLLRKKTLSFQSLADDDSNESDQEQFFDPRATPVDDSNTSVHTPPLPGGALEVHVDKAVQDVDSKWNKIEKDKVVSYLNQPKRHSLPSPKLENSINSLYKSLKDLFSSLYLLGDEQLSNSVIYGLQSHAKGRLDDYKDYLAVKAQRNITMTNYLEEFPGLVHFIYIDRSTDQLTAPSINITMEDLPEKADVTQNIKSKIWSIVRWFQIKLQQGFTTMTVRDGDFFYSYCLWFEDSGGNIIAPLRPFHGGSLEHPPGIIAENSYRLLRRQCFPGISLSGVYCYELVCVHIGLVPTKYVVDHWRRLYALLWESSEILW